MACGERARLLAFGVSRGAPILNPDANVPETLTSVGARAEMADDAHQAVASLEKSNQSAIRHKRRAIGLCRKSCNGLKDVLSSADVTFHLVGGARIADHGQLLRYDDLAFHFRQPAAALAALKPLQVDGQNAASRGNRWRDGVQF